MPSNAHELFARIKANPVPEIEALYGQSETEWLEFKAASRIDDKGKKSHWGECAGAFANTEGGVLIWGVNAKKNRDTGRDAADGPDYSPDVYALETVLKSVHLTAHNPPLQGVQFLPVPVNGNAGFLVCYVPESKSKPHRSELTTGGVRYMIRSLDNSVDVNPSLLRTMFYPMTRPLLRITGAAALRMAGPDTERIEIRLRIENIGTATASGLLVAVRPTDFDIQPESPWGRYDNLPSTPQAFRLDGQQMHPGVRFNLFIARKDHESGTSPYIRPVGFTIRVYGENALATEAQLTFYPQSSQEVSAVCEQIAEQQCDD